MADEELPVIARFDVRRRSYLAPDGTVQRALPSFASDTNLLLHVPAIALLNTVTSARARVMTARPLCPCRWRHLPS